MKIPETAWWTIRLVVAALLLASAAHHLAWPWSFLESVLRYRMVTGRTAELVAVTVPQAQLIAAGCLLTGCLCRAAWVTASLLFCLFFAAQVSVLVRGMEIDCGCFGHHGATVSLKTLVPVLVLLVVSAMGLMYDREKFTPRTPTMEGIENPSAVRGVSS